MSTTTQEHTDNSFTGAVSPGGPTKQVGSQLAGEAFRRMLLSDEVIDGLLAEVGPDGLRLTGDGGFLPQLVKAVLERGLAVELSDHLGYDKGDPAGRSILNSRNGSTPKTLVTEIGPVPVEVPRDRAGTFTPALVPKGVKRLGGGLDDMIVSLYAGGMTVRDIEHHLARTLGTEVSRDTISKITDGILEEVKAWQHRPLDPVYPVVFFDALVVKVRDAGVVTNKAAHIAVGVDTDGIKHVLGIWVQSAEGASFWAGVCAELANRGVSDILIACCDGLPGLPEAIEATFPFTVVQTCVVHLIRAATRYVAYADRKAFCAALKAVYTAANADAAQLALLELADSALGRKYPAAVAVWERAWDRFVPFLAFPPAVRKVIYTTNSIESLNYQLRKIIKNRGHFPNDDAVIKLLWLAIRDIEDKRARARHSERGLPAGKRKAPARLVEGATVPGWTAAINALDIAYPGRINPTR